MHNEAQGQGAPARQSQSQVVLEMAFDLFDFYSTSTGEPVAVKKSGPNIALAFYGRGNTLRGVLGTEMVKRKNQVLSDKAFKEVSQILASEAHSHPMDIPLRIGKHEGNLYIDLGTANGEVVEVCQSGWRIIPQSPVPFLRTVLTKEMPIPSLGGTVDQIFEYINIPLRRRDLFVGCLVASLFEDIPHPVIQFDGEQGSGKSFASQLFTELLDPSLIPRRKPPKDIETWTTTAQGSYIIGIDNVAQITPFFSDALCRAVTGEGNVERELFTNGGLFVSKFRRLVVLNGIRIAGIQDDLADRLIRFKLPTITSKERKTEKSILAGWDEQRPGIHGALLTLASAVLAELDTIELDELPRMADFALILAAMDRVLDASSLDQYLDEVNLSAVSSVSEDPVLGLIKDVIRDGWTGSSKDLLSQVKVATTPDAIPAGFPDSPRAMTALLTKVAPTLRKAGWLAKDLGSKNHDNVTIWHLAAPKF
jgi:hypothetical protein